MSMQVMLIVWAALTACFLALLAYRGTLTRYEEDQLFLSDSNTVEQSEQKEILRKVNKLGPVVRLAGGAAGLATAAIMGTYIYSAWQALTH
ncbi:hypothetical protein [Terriglobus tenax]|uniref:hypothetical protein n=1 Tax=Terriglobus tenax TaxID=1111115 RepID=UPI0021DF96D4|nr:hypothetical protein [Terriglobus tenax]